MSCFGSRSNFKFPAVTVCNLNPAMMSRIDDYDGDVDLDDYLDSVSKT